VITPLPCHRDAFFFMRPLTAHPVRNLNVRALTTLRRWPLLLHLRLMRALRGAQLYLM
jgi:hypothetical protein